MCSYFGWSSSAIKSHVRDLRRDMANCIVAFRKCVFRVLVYVCVCTDWVISGTRTRLVPDGNA